MAHRARGQHPLDDEPDGPQRVLHRNTSPPAHAGTGLLTVANRPGSQMGDPRHAHTQSSGASLRHELHNRQQSEWVRDEIRRSSPRRGNATHAAARGPARLLLDNQARTTRSRRWMWHRGQSALGRAVRGRQTLALVSSTQPPASAGRASRTARDCATPTRIMHWGHGCRIADPNAPGHASRPPSSPPTPTRVRERTEALTTDRRSARTNTGPRPPRSASTVAGSEQWALRGHAVAARVPIGTGSGEQQRAVVIRHRPGLLHLQADEVEP